MKTLLFAALLAVANPTPVPPVYEMTQAQYDATVKHRNELAAARTAKEAAQSTQLQTAGKAEDANAKLVPELQDNIKLLNSDLAAEKRHAFVNLLKGSLIAFPLGIIAAIAAFLFTKFDIALGKFAVKTGIKAVVA